MFLSTILCILQHCRLGSLQFRLRTLFLMILPTSQTSYQCLVSWTVTFFMLQFLKIATYSHNDFIINIELNTLNEPIVMFLQLDIGFANAKTKSLQKKKSFGFKALALSAGYFTINISLPKHPSTLWTICMDMDASILYIWFDCFTAGCINWPAILDEICFSAFHVFDSRKRLLLRIWNSWSTESRPELAEAVPDPPVGLWIICDETILVLLNVKKRQLMGYFLVRICKLIRMFWGLASLQILSNIKKALSFLIRDKNL